jgi:hypothetical protein
MLTFSEENRMIYAQRNIQATRKLYRPRKQIYLSWEASTRWLENCVENL